MNEYLTAIYSAILEGEAASVTDGVQAALEASLEPISILNDGMIAAMKEVGRLFEEGEYFVPEMLIAAHSMRAGLAILKPHLLSTDVKPAGKVLIGTVKGDLHDIGKNLVMLMLEGAGFEIYDLGVDVPPEKFVEAVQTSQAGVVALSALLTTTMPSMKATIDALEGAGLRGRVKIVVGGAPVTPEYARQIGADGYAPDASRAVTLVQSLLTL